jgi:hypothetical protein
MSQRRASPCGLFSRAEEKKLSDDVIEDDFTSFAIVCRTLFRALRNPLGVLAGRIAASSSKNAVNFSSARTTKRFPWRRCASAMKIVPPVLVVGNPPQMIISLPVQTAVCSNRAEGALIMLVAVQPAREFPCKNFFGLYRDGRGARGYSNAALRFSPPYIRSGHAHPLTCSTRFRSADMHHE